MPAMASMAGSEKRGVEFARADLFQGARCILTPDGATDPAALASVDGFWRALGMRVTVLSPADHDRLVSDVSHLPHAIAASLVSMHACSTLSRSRSIPWHYCKQCRALTASVSSTMKVQGRFGLALFSATVSPTIVTYLCTA